MIDFFQADATGYYPVEEDDPAYKMEGGKVDRLGNPIFTLDQYKRGEVPFVTVAMDATALPYGTTLMSPDFPDVPFRVADTGSAFKGKGLSRIDIARDSAAGANSDENNGKFTFQLAGTPTEMTAPVQTVAPQQGVVPDLSALSIGGGIPDLQTPEAPQQGAMPDLGLLAPIGEPGAKVVDARTGQPLEPAPTPIPPLAKNHQKTVNPDGSVTFDDGVTIYKEGFMTVKVRDKLLKIDSRGRQSWVPDGASAKSSQDQISDEAFAKKGGNRKDYSSEEEYLRARKSALSTERKSLTEMQIKGAAYYQRANDAAQRAEEVLKKYDPASFRMDADLLLRDTPIARRAVSDNSKRLFPIIEEFTNAVLRRDSGAAVTNIEMKRAMERYFPVPGDTPEAVAEKARNRQVTMDSLKTGVPEGTIREVGPITPEATPAATPAAQEQTYIDWAKQHPGDPRAQIILRHAGQ